MILANAAGALLGVLIGYVAWYFIRRLKKYTITTFASLVGALVGGAAINVLSANPDAVLWYVIGLFAGSVVYFVFYYLSSGGGVPLFK